MQHSFDISIAEKYGVNVAIFLNNLAFWIKKNQANNKHFYDGRYWTYNSQEAFSQLFPYWSRQNIRTVLALCEKHGLLIKGNFNESGYDRTTWYGLSDLGLSLFSCLNKEHKPIGENQPMELMKPTNSLVRTNQPIPDSKPDIKPDKRERAKNRAPLSGNFYPDEKSMELLVRKASEVDLQPQDLYEKFMNVMQSTGKQSADWQAEFQNFLINERCQRIKAFPQRDEPRSTVPDWGPGHPSYDAQHRHLNS